MGLSSSNCTYTIVAPSDPKKYQHTLPPQHQGRPLIQATLRGGLASPTASLSAKDSGKNTTMRASPPPYRHRDHHCTKHNNSSLPEPKDPQRPDSNTDQRASSSTTGKLHHLKRRGSKHDAFKKVTTPRRRCCAYKGRGLHPESSLRREHSASP
jgi:hypothetical protein